MIQYNVAVIAVAIIVYHVAVLVKPP